MGPLDRASRLFQPLTDRYHRWRDGLLVDPGFQRLAARFPPTRSLAERRASALFDLCAGFVYSQVLVACAELDALEILAEGPRTAAALADDVGLSVEATERLLEAATSLDLVERRGRDRDGAPRYGLGIHGASFVGNPEVAAMVRHHALLYRDLADPVALLRGDRDDAELRRFWTYAAGGDPGSEGDVAGYSRLMAGSLPIVAEELFDAYPIRGHQRLLDVGGGEGAFLEHVAARAPELSLTLFDLPPVASRARARFAGTPLEARVTVVGGDMFRDRLPAGADLVTLVRILHDHDDASALRLLRAIRVALPPDGTLVVAEPMRAEGERMADAYFGLYLLAMGQGRPRSPEEIAGLLAEAGFRRVRRCPNHRPFFARVLAAEPG